MFGESCEDEEKKLLIMSHNLLYVAAGCQNAGFAWQLLLRTDEEAFEETRRRQEEEKAKEENKQTEEKQVGKRNGEKGKEEETVIGEKTSSKFLP